jgi:hypothetical protein
VGDGPEFLTTGDFDNDEVLDLAVVNAGSGRDVLGEISLLFGNGDGTFADLRRYTVGYEPAIVAVSDFNRDGLPDLVASNYGFTTLGPGVSVVLGLGNRQFADPIAGDWMRTFGYGLAPGDFDGDGLEDLAKACFPCFDVGILFGNGDGTFLTPAHEEVGEEPQFVAVGDLDGDERLDLVTANLDSNDVSVLLADGAGSFGPENRFMAGTEPVWVAIGELTGDLHLDLAVANSASNDVSLLEGSGNGTFSEPTSIPVGGGFPAVPSSVAVGDFDMDDHRDLVVTDRLVNRIAVFLGNGDGTYGLPTYIPVGTDPSLVIVEDLNGDEIMDLAVTNHGSNSVSVLLGAGDGGFVAAPTLDTVDGPCHVVAGDVDGDLVLDLVTVSMFDCDIEGISSDVEVFRGHGDGTFLPPQDVSDPFFRSSKLALVDLDGDDRLDLAGNWDAPVRLGNGDGSFGPTRSFAGFGVSVASGDFNFDTRQDLVIAGTNFRSSVFVLLNQSGPSAFTFLADHATLVWPAVTGAISYDIYRGDTSVLVDGDDDGLPDSGYGACMTALDDDPRDTFFVDADTPSEGDGFFYLMSVIDALGDGGIGATSAGLPRSPQVPCP